VGCEDFLDTTVHVVPHQIFHDLEDATHGNLALDEEETQIRQGEHYNLWHYSPHIKPYCAIKKV
jgi:hypothetical protein